MSKSLFNKNYTKKIKEIYQNSKKNNEFEFIFKDKISSHDFKKVLEYFVSRIKKKEGKILLEKTLDINYTFNRINAQSYRISIRGNKYNDVSNINEKMSQFSRRKNHIIFSQMVRKIQNEAEDTSIIKKSRLNHNIYDLSDYNLRVKMSKEEQVSRSELKDLLIINEAKRFDIIFRYKNRASFIVSNNKDVTIRIDITDAKTNAHINKLSESKSAYELEVEIFIKDDMKKNDMKKEKYFETGLNEVQKLFRVLQNTEEPLTKNENKQVIIDYKKLVGSKRIYYMNARTLEILDLIDKLPSKYSVTDKADGKRKTVFINEGKVYLVNELEEVQYFDMKVDKKFNGTVIESEYVYIKDKKKYLLLCYDILFYKGKDVRPETNFLKRLMLLDDILKDCFKNNTIYSQYKGDFDLKKINKFHKQEIKKLMDDVNKKLNDNKTKNIVKRKYFAHTLGGHDCEIFTYSENLYKLYTQDPDIKCPYTLDGLIYNSVQQKYTSKRKETKYPILKWKPENMNSIDFYIEFEKDERTGEILKIFDNSLNTEAGMISTNEEEVINEVSKDKYYVLCNLYVYDVIDNKQRPVLFRKRQMGYTTKIYFKSEEDAINGVIKDMEGEIIQDKTVVEFYFDKGQFHAMRTRFDKTDSVNKFGTKYGNHIDTANSIWETILNPIKLDDLKNLADPKLYKKSMNDSKKKIDRRLISKVRSQNSYYQKSEKVAQNMTAFHNFIKSNLIYIHCGKQILKGGKEEKLSVLDVGCGVGGDFLKFYRARVKLLVAFDPVYESINSMMDSAKSRYDNNLRKYPNMAKEVPMSFLVADAYAPLNYEDQKNIISRMDDNNKELIIKYFGKNDKDKNYTRFHVINHSLMFHYLLKDDLTLDTHLHNINKLLKLNGTVLITTMDGAMIHKNFDKEGKISQYYKDANGDEQLLFEWIRKYDPETTDIKTTGLAIDFHMKKFMDAGIHQTEYIVEKNFLISEMKKKCNLELIETATFEEYYNNSKSFIEDIGSEISSSKNDKTRQYLNNVKKYYNRETSEDKACFEFTKYHRYYIFKKYERKKVQKGSGNKNEKKEYDYEF